MRRAWFAYTAGSKGPEPVIYYDELPNEKNYLNPRILQKWELRDNYIQQDGEVWQSFKVLSEDFPYTGNEYDLGEKVTLDDLIGTDNPKA